MIITTSVLAIAMTLSGTCTCKANDFHLNFNTGQSISITVDAAGVIRFVPPLNANKVRLSSMQCNYNGHYASFEEGELSC